MTNRMHVHSSLKDKGLCYRLRWPIIVFGCLLTVADILFQTTATYHSQFKSAWNPVWHTPPHPPPPPPPSLRCPVLRLKPVALLLSAGAGARVQGGSEDGEQTGVEARRCACRARRVSAVA